MLRRVVASLAGVAGVSLAFACSLGTGPLLFATLPDAAAPPVTLFDDGSTSGALDVDLGASFAIDGLVPAHGPFTGGTSVTINGRGFPSTLRVVIGGTTLPSSSVFASEPTRAVAQTPPGAPGPADVTILDDSTAEERTLPGGFTYDAIELVPNQGSTTGGTLVSIVGQGTSFDATTNVAIDGMPCTRVAVTDATHLTCVTPADTPGAKDVTVTSESGSLQVADAYTYSDSPDGYRGGLAGGVLAGNLEVLAFDSWSGAPIAGAYVIAGSITQTTGASGIAQLADPSLTGAVTVTIAGTCHQPLTFVDVPVDTVTAYLPPVLSPSCASDPGSTGGGVGPQASEVQGELVFPGVEFQVGPWTVPAPTKATERQAAYVFSVAGSPSSTFSLPDPSTATLPTDVGTRGYTYSYVLGPGNATLYALAGIEDRSATPPTFVPYVMGVARGVQVAAGAITGGIDIPMTTLLDHQVTLAPSPPAPGTPGPDRLAMNVAVTIGQLGFAVFPNGARTSLLPLTGNVPFVGLPALEDGLAGEQYVIAASAGTGASLGAPGSIVADVQTTDSNDPIVIGGFPSPPVVTEPSSSAWPGTHVAATVAGSIDLFELQVTSGQGLVAWTIVSPGATTTFDLPNLDALPGGIGLIPGPLQVTAWGARIGSFTYATLRTGQMSTGGWSAYGYDDLSSVH